MSEDQQQYNVAPAPKSFSLAPSNLGEALQLAKYMAESSLVPKQYIGKPGDCLIAMQLGAEIGLSPMQALQSIAVINGKPGIYGDAGKALLLAAGCKIEESDIEEIKKAGIARCKITRPNGNVTERSFSKENAVTAGLWSKDGPWKNYPERQMAWRAFWFAARDGAADILRGMAGAEELADYPATPTAERVEAEVSQPRVNALSDKLKQAKEAIDPKEIQVSLEDILNDIEKAIAAEDMTRMRDIISVMPDKEMRAKAGKAWQERLKILKQAGTDTSDKKEPPKEPAVDRETGEIKGTVDDDFVRDMEKAESGQ